METTPRVTIDDLLAHAGWARTLARALIVDPHDADDLVQETWIAALQHPPAPSASPRPWLARVMRNLARNRWRGSMRRTRRELAAAQPEAQPGSDDVAHELEMHAALVEALSDLDEALGRTVVRRYFHGLSSAEIARSEGVPESTVRNRLQRALELLRAKLDRKYGDRSTWAALLLPLVTRDGIPATAAITGVITMSAFWKAAAAVAVSLTMGAWAWDRLQPRAESAASVVDSPLDSSALAAAPRNDVANPPGAETRAPIATSVAPPPVAAVEAVPPGVIEARAVDPDGLPITDAELQVVDRLDLGEIEAGDAPRTQSDDSGRLRLEVRRSDRSPHRGSAGNAPKNVWTLDIAIGAHGRETHREHVKVTDGGTTPLGDVTLRPGGVVSGRVVGPSATSKRRPWVEVIPPNLTLLEQEQGRSTGFYSNGRFASASLRADGSYELVGVPVGTYRIVTGGRSPEVLEGCTAPFDVRAAETTNVPDIVLDANPNVIEGTVLGQDGSPVRGSEIGYMFSRSAESGEGYWVGTSSDEAGRFSFALPTPRRCDIYAQDNGRQRGEAVVRNVPTGTRDLVLRLRAAEWIDVTVVDEQGRPIPAFGLDGQFEAEGSTFFTSGGPHPGGRARVLVKAVPFFVEVSAPERCSRRVGPFDPDHHPAELAITLPPLVPIQGRVLSAGEPVAGAEVSLRRAVAQGRLHACNGFPCRFDNPDPAAATTDSDGRFSITVRDSGSFALLAVAAGFAEAETPVVAIDPDVARPEFRIELARGGRLEGSVIAAAGRSPEGTLVGISRGDGMCRVTRTSADGGYTFEHLAAGRWSIRRCERDFVAGGEVTHRDVAGFDPTLAEFSIEDGKTTRFDFDLRGAETSVEGKLPAGLLRSGTWSVSLRADEESAAASAASLGPDGTFRLMATVLGPQLLRFADSGENDRDQEITSPIQLDRGVNDWRISVTTGALEGEAAPHALLRHTWKNAAGTTCTTHFLADAEGRFHVEGIPAGSGSVEMLRPKTVAGPTVVDVPENGVAHLTLR